MTRASLILDELDAKSLFETCIHEAMNIPQTKKMLQDFAGRARQVNPKFKSQLTASGKVYKRELDEMTAEHPELHAALNKDIATYQDKSKELGTKVKGKLSKLKKIRKGRITEASIMEEVAAELDTFDINEGTVATLSALRGLRITKDVSWINRILWGLLAYIGTMMLATLHTSILIGLAAVIGPYAPVVCAVVIAPITEEYFKKLSVLASDGSKAPAFVFTMTEFYMYVSHAMVVGVGIAANPALGVSYGVYLAVSIIGRIFAAEMHMTTTKWYVDDYKKLGYIRDETLKKGIGFHRLWNAAATIFSVLSAFAVALLGFNPVIGGSLVTIGAIVGLAALAQKLMKNEKERVTHTMRANPVPAYA